MFDKIENDSISKINTYKIIFKNLYKMGSITDDVIVNLLKYNPDDVIKFLKNSKSNVITELLGVIYFCPFILCDQEYISDNLKLILPVILNNRYSVELAELKNELNRGLININEFNKLKDDLTFNYFYTSEDGKKILKTNKNIQKNN